MGNYRELAVWQQAHSLAMDIYRSTMAFPEAERYGLAAQMRRAAVSVVSNIAEGSARNSDRDEVRFFRIAQGSACELECQLLLARDVGLLAADAWVTLDRACRGVGKMLNGLIRSYRTHSYRR
jgi:four helix bundle protein